MSQSFIDHHTAPNADKQNEAASNSTNEDIEEDIDSSEYDSSDDDEHDRCEVGQQFGEIIQCNTCPNGYHLACLAWKSGEVPGNGWSCPACKDGSKVTYEQAFDMIRDSIIKRYSDESLLPKSDGLDFVQPNISIRAIHANHTRILPKDLELARRIRGDRT